MNGKAYLVARREYVENLRTKTFWVGILFFPLLISLMIVVPLLLERTKDVRRYAVLDKSGWLLEEIETRAQAPDLKRIFEVALAEYRKESADFGALPPELQRATRELARALDPVHSDDMAPDARNAVEDRILSAFTGALAGIASAQELELPGLLSQKQARDLLALSDTITQWWEDLPPGEAAKLSSGLSKGRYLRVALSREEEDLEALNQRIVEGDLFAYFVIGRDPLTGDQGSRYVSDNLTDDALKNWFSRLASEVVRQRRLDSEGIDAEVARWVQDPLYFTAKRVTGSGVEKEVGVQDMARQWAPVAFVYLLWISIFVIAQMLLTNTIEEKSNRIMEVLLSSVSPVQLLAGKIGGIAATGLTMVFSWIVFFYAAVSFLPQLMGAQVNVNLSAIATDPVYLVSFVGYFFLGYLLFSAILVGIGSVCNSLKEAQNLMMPITILLMVPLASMIPIGRDPNGTLAKFMSYIPPFTPFVMMNRAAGPPSTTEYVTTTLLLVATILLVLWGAAKVFRIGILMTGKPPRPTEILKWLRAPVGQVQQRKLE